LPFWHSICTSANSSETSPTLLSLLKLSLCWNVPVFQSLVCNYHVMRLNFTYGRIPMKSLELSKYQYQCLYQIQELHAGHFTFKVLNFLKHMHFLLVICVY
jgi:hypothetical protein